VIHFALAAKLRVGDVYNFDYKDGELTIGTRNYGPANTVQHFRQWIATQH